MKSCNAKKTCELCGREITVINYSKHIRSHENHPEKFNKVKVDYAITHDVLICQFCGKECKNKNSLCQHGRFCKENPNRQTSYFSIYNKSHSAWNRGLTKDTDERVAKQSNSLKATYILDPTLAQRTGGFKQSQTAKRCKWGVYQGYYCDSSWELAFVIYCLDHSLPLIRNTDYFNYVIEDKEHKYYPDFFLNGEYYEIKGSYTKADIQKINQFPNDLVLNVIDSSNIKKYLNYAKQNYGDFSLLYDRSYNSWLDATDGKYNFKISDKE